MSAWRTRTRRSTPARIIAGIGAVFAAIEILYVLMVLVGANTGNAFFQFVATLAGPLALFFPGLFPAADPKLAVLLDYGLAAVFWLVVANLVARVVNR